MKNKIRFIVLPLIGMITLFGLSMTAMMTATRQEAWAQSGTVPGGTIPGGTIPGGTVPPPYMIYLGFKTSDEIEYPDDAQPDFVYKNEDVVAFNPATGLFSTFFDGSICGLADANLDDFEILPDGHLIFTLRAPFTIPNLGDVDDSDIIEYTPNASGCGSFAFKLKGAEIGLTQGAEDIDALGITADGNILVSTIGTARVPSATGELTVRDQALIKFNEATGFWSLYFDGEDVGLTDSSEDIRSVWEDPILGAAGAQKLYLTMSGDFSVASNNSDTGDKNDVEGCTLLQAGETTECSFFKVLNGEAVGAGNQLDGLAVLFNGENGAAAAITGQDENNNQDESIIEMMRNIADFTAALAEGDGEVTIDDFIEIATQIYLPLIQGQQGN